MASPWELVKKGNATSAAAAAGNTALALVKGVAAFYSGSGTMFATAMHSVADAVNQGFVFTGSVLAERKPTRRFPTGFGRVINIFCMVAVIVVTIMAYETILEGFHLLNHPAQSSHFWLNFLILVLAIGTDGYVLIKAMREIVEQSRVDAKGLGIVPAAFRHVKRAAPPTRLVFYEDLVGTSGSLLALIAIMIGHFTNIAILDGIATILIGFLMVGVVFRVGYDNMVGLIGVAAPRVVEEKVAKIILSDSCVTDINMMRITQEGRFYHVESYMELQPGLSLADADDVKFRVQDKLLNDADIADVTLGIIEDNGVRDWTPEKLNELE
ncbi:cation diffusion facilitator family transporter [Aneurinibacillus tyrosinisolvens]|uniref:cation diffusion facilitator family transporter n=1 Tax=Aneurinibacillus tyrosinisolvens TaxID=1443435 RepID=UPI00063F7664|nr:cation diffusion facilitator family transporter [Aneurinibacillus tyrosinisolvens]